MSSSTDEKGSSTSTARYGPARSDEMEALVSLQSWAFCASSDRVRKWLESAELKNLRVVRRGGEPTASLILIPMGQWFGGRPVPMVGIAGVGTAPEARGQGEAKTLMRHVVSELRAGGVPLSTLYPATLPLYRSAGYERAGSRFRLQLEVPKIHMRPGTEALRPATEADQVYISGVYRRFVRGANGPLDRSDVMWNRIRSGYPDTRGWVVERAGQIDGYLYAREKRHEDGSYDVLLSDLVALSAESARRLLGFLACHGSQARHVVWYGAPNGPLLAMLPELCHRITLEDHWMLRVVDVPAALEGRGYPHVAEDRVLDLAVRDDVFGQKAQRYRLRVVDGDGMVEPGGNGDFEVDVRGLAALYSGFLSPFELRTAGLVDSPAGAMETAEAIFLGRCPYMVDVF